jgi:hypothetical protein
MPKYKVVCQVDGELITMTVRENNIGDTVSCIGAWLSNSRHVDAANAVITVNVVDDAYPVACARTSC